MKLVTCLLSLSLCATNAQSVYAQRERNPPQPTRSSRALIKPKPAKAVTPRRKPTARGERSLSRRIVLRDLAEALSIVESNYPGHIPKGRAIPAAIDGALASLDPHSSYFDADQFRELLDEEEGVYSGIGATIASFRRHGSLDTYVLSTIPGSPADRAGLKFGDRIISVNSRSVEGLTSVDVRDTIRGSDGAQVRISVETAAHGVERTIDVGRATVSQPTVSNYFMLRPGIGYIEISDGFNQNTANEFDLALAALKKLGLSALLVDLRGNPGGILESSIRIAEKFLPAGTLILSQRGRHPADNQVWRSANKAPETMPLVLIVDAGSASAAEVVAGALQDNDRALIVGKRTFGKGLVQSVFDLPRSTGMTLTTGRYYTPSGRSIQRDYSKAGLYDYYKNDASSEVSSDSQPSRTVTQRPVYSGNGISPDEFVKPASMSDEQADLLDPIFFFVRDSLRQQEAGTQLSLLMAAPLSKERAMLFSQFQLYVQEHFPELEVTALRRNEEFVLHRLRHDAIMALQGPHAAARHLAEHDTVLSQAIAAIPRARSLALLARELRTTRPPYPKSGRVKAQKKPAD